MATYKEHYEYDCEVIQQGFETSKVKETPGFFLVVRPVGEINPNNPDQVFECPSFQRKLTLWITEKTVDRHIENLRKIGFTGNAFAELDPARPNAFSFVGSEVRLVCKHQPDQNDPEKVYDQFDFPYEPNSQVLPSDGKVSSKLDALFGKKLKAATVNGNAKPQPQSQPKQEPVASVKYANDEVPF